MKKIATFLLVFFSVIAYSQNVGIGTTTPHVSAALDVTSSTKGILIPRLSSLPANPAKGLLIFYQENFWYYDGAQWRLVGKDSETIQSYLAPMDNFRSGSSLDEQGYSITQRIGFSNIFVGHPGASRGATADCGNIYDGQLLSGTNRILWKTIGVVGSDAPLTSDKFGYSLAGTGSDLVAGAPGRDEGGINRGAVYYAYIPSGSPNFSLLPNPTVHDDNDQVGKSVDIATSTAGTVVVAGAPDDDGGYGAAHTWYKPSAGAMAYETRLINGSSAPTDNFGYSVSVSLNNDETGWLFVGAPFANAGGTRRGAFYIYKRNTVTNTWQIHQTINGTQDEGKLGYSICHARGFSGGRQILAVGQPALTFVSGGPLGNYQASVNLYQYDTLADSWSFSASINPSNRNQVGQSVDIKYSGTNTIELVSGHSEGFVDGNISSNFGVAHSYQFNGTSWVSVRKLMDINGDVGYGFGKSVCIALSNLVVGSPGARVNNLTNHGKVTVFNSE